MATEATNIGGFTSELSAELAVVEAMTTFEAGTAVGVEHIPEESRAVAIHEAGHAAAGHVYLKGAESTRLSAGSAVARSATTRGAQASA